MTKGTMTRRAFAVTGLAVGASALMGMAGCAQKQVASTGNAAEEGELGNEENASGSLSDTLQSDARTNALPVAEPDSESMFGVDKNINMETIDAYVLRDDAVYRDMRMLDDPADYAAIGGNSKLDIALEGFKTVPYPYVGTLQELPVSGAYDGPCLYAVEWAEDGTAAAAAPNYRQADLILEEVFPKDKNIILVCGGGGYAGMMRQLLIHLGWDEARIYNAGGVWEYAGNKSVQLITYENPDKPTTYPWRADVVSLPFEEFDTI